jgi:hypothetical protein
MSANGQIFVVCLLIMLGSANSKINPLASEESDNTTTTYPKNREDNA